MFAIPPNEGNYSSPPADATFGADAELVDMMPHMHLRGKDMTYHLIYPDGRDEIVLSVPHYDFNWQVVYNPATPVRIPKGAKIHVEAHYNNSTSNKFNPNPNRTVYPGTMTWEEMMSPFFGVIVDRNIDPRTVLQRGETLLRAAARSGPSGGELKDLPPFNPPPSFSPHGSGSSPESPRDLSSTCYIGL
jgi:hypothetical protein